MIILGLVVVVAVVEQVEELLKLLGACVFEGTMDKPAAKSTNNKKYIYITQQQKFRIKQQ